MECTQRSNRDCGFLRTYTIIHAYFALVQGSSYYVSSPSFLYPPWVGDMQGGYKKDMTVNNTLNQDLFLNLFLVSRREKDPFIAYIRQNLEK